MLEAEGSQFDSNMGFWQSKRETLLVSTEMTQMASSCSGMQKKVILSFLFYLPQLSGMRTKLVITLPGLSSHKAWPLRGAFWLVRDSGRDSAVQMDPL